MLPDDEPIIISGGSLIIQARDYALVPCENRLDAQDIDGERFLKGLTVNGVDVDWGSGPPAIPCSWNTPWDTNALNLISSSPGPAQTAADCISKPTTANSPILSRSKMTGGGGCARARLRRSSPLRWNEFPWMNENCGSGLRSTGSVP